MPPAARPSAHAILACSDCRARRGVVGPVPLLFIFPDGWTGVLDDPSLSGFLDAAVGTAVRVGVRYAGVSRFQPGLTGSGHVLEVLPGDRAPHILAHGGGLLVRGFGRDQRGEHQAEEHTSELQSPCNLVCRLLLEKT